MKNGLLLKGFLLFFLFTCIAFTGKSQNTPVSGKITGTDGVPLDGVTVTVKGTGISTLTKADGTYQINVPEKNSVLVFSYVGYTSQEFQLKGNSTVDLSLISVDNTLNDVVVVGYGTRKKVEVTGATTSIAGEDLRTVQTTNLTQSLQGRLAGVDVTPSGFRPGSGSTIRIRGNRSLSAGNDPLYVVDGFPVSYTIDDMNPADIESIDILKDASATAIYGVRGANGVVQITTRKGKAGKLSVSYQGTVSVDQIIRPNPVFNSVELADAWRQAFFAERRYTPNRNAASASNPLSYFPNAVNDYALFRDFTGSDAQWNSIMPAYTWKVYDPANKIFIAEKRATTEEEKQLLRFYGVANIDSVDLYDPSKIKSYDWQNNEGLRNGITTNHSISVAGGSDKIRSSLNASYFRQEGIEYGQDYTRYTVGNSTEFHPIKALTFGLSVNYIHSITNTSTSTYANASGMIPMVEPYDSAGNWIMFPNNDRQIVSAVNDRNTVFDETTVDRVFGNVFAEIGLAKGLKYRTMFGLDTRNSVRGTFNGAQSSIRLGSPANASQTRSDASSWVYDNILTYNTRFGTDHSLTITGLQELQSLNKSSSMTMSAQNLIFESQKWYSLNRNTDALVTGSGTYQATQYLSYMGRVEYGYKSKYTLNISARYDNSSVLAEGNKGSWFPSASAAWQIDRENFFSNQNFLDYAKLRVGAGVVGNASIGPYQTGGPLGFTNYNWGNGVAAIGSAPTTFATPNLGWEKTTTYNAGLEFGFLKSRITGVIDVYKSITKDGLQTKSIPTANGVDYVYVNLGQVSNKGIEITLNTTNIESPKFRWTSNIVFTKNKERLDDIDGSGNSNYNNLWILGEPMQVYWGFKSAGIFQFSDTAKGGELESYYWQKPGNKGNATYSPGRINILDADGDTAFSQGDRVVLGSHNPDFIASFSNTFTLGNFELNFMIYWRQGGLYRVPRPGLVGRYQSNKVNYWTPTNPSNEYQQPSTLTDVPLNWEALTYRDASYVKVRNINLTYRFPESITKRLHMNNLAIYVSALNPFLIHSASDYDPETVPYREFPGTTTNQVGPTSYSFRSYLVGLKLNL